MEEDPDPWNIFFWFIVGFILMVSSIVFILVYSPRDLFYLFMIPVAVLDLGISMFFFMSALEELREFWETGGSMLSRARALQDRLESFSFPMDQKSREFLGRIFLFLFFTITVAFIHKFIVLLDILIFILMVLGIIILLFVLDPA